MKPIQSKKKHPDYARWQAMQQRCNRVKSRDYPEYGGRGIKICVEWQQQNKDGFFNFVTWLEQQANYDKLKCGYVFARKNVNKDYCPDNCEIVLAKVSTQRKRTSRLTLEIVVAVRKLVKEKPDLSLDDLIGQYGFGSRTLWSNALRGVTWQNATELETPIEDRPAFRETRSFKHGLDSLPLHEVARDESERNEDCIAV